jgi:PAS domain-containing protein
VALITWYWSFHFDLVDACMLQPLSALSRPPQNSEGNFDARAHVRGNDGWRIWPMTSCHGRTISESQEFPDLLQAHLSMQAAIDSLPDPVVIFSVEGSLQNVNQAAQTLLGLTSEMGVKEPLKAVDASVRSRAHA